MENITIMLVCSAGMSTSLLVTKMKKAAKESEIDVDIFAISASEADHYLDNQKIDILMLGPQVRYMKKQFEKKVSDKEIPVEVIDMRDYGMVNGQKVLETALASLN